ncbi:MAG: hypothetical protein ACFFCI_02380 [Promethearchaeota archaeon]
MAERTFKEVKIQVRSDASTPYNFIFVMLLRSARETVLSNPSIIL